MKFFVTGVNGQLGHDVMNELYKRGHEGVGSGSAPGKPTRGNSSRATTGPTFNAAWPTPVGAI